MSKQRMVFAAGCFWGVQYYFDQVPGVIRTTVGYTGGHEKAPTYEAVCRGRTGHAEAVLVEFDDDRVKCETLVRHFFRLHDPTQLNRQGPDVGEQYRSSIYYFNQSQKEAAEEIKQKLQPEYQRPIVTEIQPSSIFYAAEDYHQKFTQRTGRGMCHVPYKAAADSSLL
jgi:methionine-S-sulfoxide reductase